MRTNSSLPKRVENEFEEYVPYTRTPRQHNTINKRFKLPEGLAETSLGWRPKTKSEWLEAATILQEYTQKGKNGLPLRLNLRELCDRYSSHSEMHSFIRCITTGCLSPSMTTRGDLVPQYVDDEREHTVSLLLNAFMLMSEEAEDLPSVAPTVRKAKNSSFRKALQSFERLRKNLRFISPDKKAMAILHNGFVRVQVEGDVIDTRLFAKGVPGTFPLKRVK